MCPASCTASDSAWFVLLVAILDVHPAPKQQQQQQNQHLLMALLPLRPDQTCPPPRPMPCRQQP
jgi:hypothetical protein